MKPAFRTRYLLPFLLMGSLLAACDDQATSVWDPDVTPPSTPPVLNSISPEGGYLAGVDAITITGSGFSTVASENKVYFSNEEEKGMKGLVLSATATQLEVRPPIILGQDVKVVVYREGSENYSNELSYALSSPILNAYPTFNSKADDPLAITLDKDLNLYVALVAGGSPAGVVKVDAQGDGAVSSYVLPNNRFRFDGMEFSPDGRLYIAIGIRGVLQGLEGQKDAAHFIMPNPFVFLNMDMDEDGYMWLVGNNTHIVRHVPQTERVNITNISQLPDNTKLYPFEAEIRAVQYFGGFLYLLGSDDGGAKIWKATLDDNSDVTEVNVFVDLETALGDVASGDVFNDMVLSADGMVYVATNRTEGVIAISADGQQAGPLYEGVLYPNVVSLEWGEGVYLYAATLTGTLSTSKSSMIKINMQKQGAPEY